MLYTITVVIIDLMRGANNMKPIVIGIAGGTGSGKTTFLNALSNYIPKEERIITIEDSAELQIVNIDNLVSLETRNALAETEIVFLTSSKSLNTPSTLIFDSAFKSLAQEIALNFG